MHNKKKILIRIILIIALISASFIITTVFLMNIPFGITLPFGWSVENYNNERLEGFPFSVWSYYILPIFGVSVPSGFNLLAHCLDFIFCMVVIIALYRLIKRALRSKTGSNVVP